MTNEQLASFPNTCMLLFKQYKMDSHTQITLFTIISRLIIPLPFTRKSFHTLFLIN